MAQSNASAERHRAVRHAVRLTPFRPRPTRRLDLPVPPRAGRPRMTGPRAALLMLGFAAALLAGQPACASGGAVLQGLDKVTARIFTFDAPLDRPVRFGRLQIVARACNKTPPEEPPESAAFLEITELPPDGEPRRLFTGWMFASSPALSALEHPVYDIWVVDCMNDASSSSPKSQ